MYRSFLDLPSSTAFFRLPNSFASHLPTFQVVPFQYEISDPFFRTTIQWSVSLSSFYHSSARSITSPVSSRRKMYKYHYIAQKQRIMLKNIIAKEVRLTRVLRLRVGPVGALWLSLWGCLLFVLTFSVLYAAFTNTKRHDSCNYHNTIEQILSTFWGSRNWVCDSDWEYFIYAGRPFIQFVSREIRAGTDVLHWRKRESGFKLFKPLRIFLTDKIPIGVFVSA